MHIIEHSSRLALDRSHIEIVLLKNFSKTIKRNGHRIVTHFPLERFHTLIAYKESENRVH